MKYILSRSDQLRIVKMCHVDPTSGHLGITKSVSRIKERFMWKGVWKDVKDMVRIHILLVLFVLWFLFILFFIFFIITINFFFK